MTSIRFSSIKKVIGESADADYIASALTPWHAHSVVAAVHKLEATEGRPLKGIILITHNWDEKCIIDESDFSGIEAEFYFYDYTKTALEHMEYVLAEFFYAALYSRKNSIKEDKGSFYILSQQLPNLSLMCLARNVVKQKKIISVLCDEGAGSYATIAEILESKATKYRHSWLYQIKNSLEKKFIYPRGIENLKASAALYKFYLLSFDKGRYYTNQNMKVFFEQAIREHIYSKQDTLINMPENYVIFNTQPVEKKLFEDESAVYAFWRKISEIFQAAGYNVFVKPHPREKEVSFYEKNGMQILNLSMVQEDMLMIVDHKPEFVVSLYSTTLITAKVINNIETICVGKMLFDLVKATELYKVTVSGFLEKFSLLTNIVDDEKELVDFVSKN